MYEELDAPERVMATANKCENPIEVNREEVEECEEFWILWLAPAVPTLEQWKQPQNERGA